MSNVTKLTENCIHCGLCTRKCAFLQKYKMDLQSFGQHPELAYHCVLCGECTRACPKKIDGREVALQLRRDSVDGNAGKIAEKGYGALIAEKKDYLFRNQKKAAKKSVLFPGCNFPSFFPETTEYLVKLLKDTADIGVWYDCCGKPVSELGLAKEDEKGLNGLKQRIDKLGIEEIIVLCPNCYHFLKPRLDIPVVSIYTKLQELGLGSKIREEKVNLFVPCPDKASLELEKSLLPFIDGEAEIIKGIQCCGQRTGDLRFLCNRPQGEKLTQRLCLLRLLRRQAPPQRCEKCAPCAGGHPGHRRTVRAEPEVHLEPGKAQILLIP